MRETPSIPKGIRKFCYESLAVKLSPEVITEIDKIL